MTTLLVQILLPACGWARGEPAWPIGAEALHRLDLLPAFKPAVRVGAVSSYDRTGGNDDGFSGAHSFIRKENGGLVIADLKGPGIITRIWTPTPTDDPVDFFFDDEPAPRLTVSFRDLFSGRQPPFEAPLAGFGAGGFFNYVPIGFQKACRIVVRTERLQFYQINYAIYPEDAPVQTFRPVPEDKEAEHLARARRLFAAFGEDVAAYAAPPGAEVRRERREVRLEPGGTVVLFASEQPGRIVGLRLTPAGALARKERDILLRVTFDDEPEPAILCPAGDFFGYAWGRPAATSLLLGTSGDTAYCYLPMPFDRRARIELVSEQAGGQAVTIAAEVAVAPVGRSAGEGRLYALWRRENPTTEGVPFTFVDVRGRGHLVGCVLQCQGLQTGQTLYFEGDDQTTIDGEPAIHGTGSEDFFNGGWYDVPDRWEKRRCFPLSGCLAYQKPLGRTGGYRFMIADAYSFRQSLRHTIEHGGNGNEVPGDYCATTWLYAEQRPEPWPDLPPAGRRAVADPPVARFVTGWSVPVHAFPFSNASLAKASEKIDGQDVRYLHLKVDGGDWFGPPFISPVCDLPADGMYDISIEAVMGPAQGKVQLFADEAPVGEPVDLYAPARRNSGAVRLGTLALREGPNNVMLKIVGRNEASTGLNLDLVAVLCTRLDEGGNR